MVAPNTAVISWKQFPWKHVPVWYHMHFCCIFTPYLYMPLNCMWETPEFNNHIWYSLILSRKWLGRLYCTVHQAVEVCPSSRSIILQSVLMPHMNTMWKFIHPGIGHMYIHWYAIQTPSLNHKLFVRSWRPPGVVNVYVSNATFQDRDQSRVSNYNSEKSFCSFEGIMKVL
jgi:hypothetical protein